MCPLGQPRTAIAKKELARRILGPLVEWGFVAATSTFALGYLGIVISLTLYPLTYVGRRPARARWVRFPSHGLFVLLVLFGFTSIWIVVKLFYHAGLIYLFAYAAASLLCGMVCDRTRMLGLKWHHGLLVGSLVSLFAVGALLTVTSWGSACGAVKMNEGTRLILDHGQFPYMLNQPRFLVLDPEERTLAVGYRFRFPQANVDYGVIMLDRETGRSRVVPLDGEAPIALTYDPIAGSFASVIVSDRKGASLVWIEKEGVVSKRIDLERAISRTYFCFIEPGEDEIRIHHDKQVCVFARDGRPISSRRLRMEGLAILTFGNATAIGDRLFLSFGGFLWSDPIQPTIVALDRSTLHQVGSLWGISCGTEVLAVDRVRNEIYTNSQWSGRLEVVDFDLHRLRRIDLGGAVRCVVVDGARRRGYAALYTEGKVLAFDLDSGRILGSVEIGPGARSLGTTREGDVLAGSACGVTLAHPAAFGAAS